MNNERLNQKSWWKRNWKWCIILAGLGLIFGLLFFSSTINTAITNLGRAYANPQLYEEAVEKVKTNPIAIELLGTIKPIDKLAILEGSVGFSNANTTVNSTIRIRGEKLTAKMDITADKIGDSWNYRTIRIRIKNPPEKRQTIEILTAK